MRVLRPAILAAVAAFLCVATSTSSAAVSAPTGLHGFLLRADEPATTTFHRTPSFAWNPVPGALKYQFQLSTSSTFRDNGVLYSDSTLRTPVSAPTLTLPWITGSPHALYGRVRAMLATDTTAWSAPFGFDITPPDPPTPLPGYPGVLRWTPTEGADEYEVWLVDAGKHEFVRTNVLDEREFYTFHQTAPFMGTVHWRIRAWRGDEFKQRLNGIPISSTGAWSPVYTSTNPAVTSAPITLTGTLSDVFSDGSPGSPAHSMTPAFLWSGNRTLSGATADLYRVEVFTDSQCLNRVWTGAVVGSPAWAPRLTGTLALPSDPSSLVNARTAYLGDGSESADYSYDGYKLSPSPVEQQGQATPTTGVPGDLPASPGTQAPTDGTADPSTTGGTQGIQVTGTLGPPVSLWDTDWPASGYYWTVIPVAVAGSNGGTTTVGVPGAPKGATTIPVLETSGFHIGDTITIGVAPTADTATVSAVGAGSLTISTATAQPHSVGDPVVRAGSSLQYVDTELPQDVCAAGRIQRVGIESEPSLTSAQTPFATGLSSTGRLTSAVASSRFYGSPLVAWTPAFNADLYEIQYSKTAYPFKPEIDPRSSVRGFLTFDTSDVLPLTSGTWYYRVRGVDFSLPTGDQQMSWSDAQKLVVSPPTFKLADSTGTTFKFVGSGSTAKKTATKYYNMTGFSLSVPTTWTKTSSGQSSFVATTRSKSGYVTRMSVSKVQGRGARSLTEWASALAASARAAGAVGTVAQRVVSLPGGNAVYLAFAAKNQQGKLVEVVYYFVDAGSAAYGMGFVTLTSLVPSYQAMFTKIAQSFRHK
ncbi:MAG TPA: hypothetical protein VGH82_05660 [Gaiellaceae bacterium]